MKDNGFKLIDVPSRIWQKRKCKRKNVEGGRFRSEMEQSKNRLLIDVREPDEYKSGFIPGAKNIPLSQLEKRIGEIPKDRDVLLYCHSGMRSKSAARILSKQGYTRLAHLQGGVSSWKGKLSRR